MLSKTTARHTMTDVLKVKLERPPHAGKNWEGVRHAELLQTVRRTLENNKLKPGPAPTVHLARNGALMAAAFSVGGVPGANFGRADVVPCLGLVASNNRRRRLTFYCGVRVISADAGVCFHRAKARRHYTIEFDLKDEVNKLVDDWLDHAEDLPERIDELRGDGTDDLNRTEAMTYFTAAAERGLLPNERAMAAIRTIVEKDSKRGSDLSRFDLAVEFGREAAKNPPTDVMDQQHDFLELVRESEPVKA